MMRNSGIAERVSRWSYKCGDGYDCLEHEAVVGFVAIGAQRMRKRGKRCGFDAGMERNHDM